MDDISELATSPDINIALGLAIVRARSLVDGFVSDACAFELAVSLTVNYAVAIREFPRSFFMENAENH